MDPLAFAPPKAIVPVFTVLVVVFATSLNAVVFVHVPPWYTLPRRTAAQFVSDLRRRERLRTWFGLIGWCVLVTGLHFGGLARGLYTRIWWWDLLTHTMAGAGVAGIALLGTRDVVPVWMSDWWVVVTVVAIGAGFELYEFLFKSFWHSWTVSFYLQDTLIDLGMDAVGGFVALAVSSTLLVRTKRATTV